MRRHKCRINVAAEVVVRRPLSPHLTDPNANTRGSVLRGIVQSCRARAGSHVAKCQHQNQVLVLVQGKSALNPVSEATAPCRVA